MQPYSITNPFISIKGPNIFLQYFKAFIRSKDFNTLEFHKLHLSLRNFNTNLGAPGHSLIACNPKPPAKSKMAARGPQNGWQGLEGKHGR